MKKLIIKIFIACIVLAVISLVLINWDDISKSVDVGMAQEETAIEHAQQHADPNYVCPMHSQITDNKASSCPICGMDLELRESPTSSDASDGTSEAVFISAAMLNNLGVRLEHVDKGRVAEEVYASGFVEKVSAAQEESVNSKVSAALVGVPVELGEWVEEGDVLVVLGVESYYDTVTKYMDALDNSHITKALKLREQLLAMGVGDEVLAGYDQDHPMAKNLEIVAPFSGEVTWVLDQAIAEGGQVEIGTKLVQVTAPSLAEVDLRSYSRVARGIKEGHIGQLGVAHLPGRTWPGRVVEVIHNRAGFYSALRFHVEVPYGVLEPGSFAGAYVSAGTLENVLRVPSSAVIYDENSTRVIRLRDDEGFDAVEVVLGFEGHKWIEIKAGLSKGDHVVTRGQFLIDSEATLQAGFKRLSQN